jgi:hypothetical protein
MDNFEIIRAPEGAYAQRKPLKIPGTVDKLVISQVSGHYFVKGLDGRA